LFKLEKNSNNHPVRSLSMLRDFFNGRGHPSCPGGAMALIPFIHTFRTRLHWDLSRMLMPQVRRAISFLQAYRLIS
jgi:hypothetical protein